MYTQGPCVPGMMKSGQGCLSQQTGLVQLSPLSKKTKDRKKIGPRAIQASNEIET